jgi:hypothetical protein
MRQWHQSQQTNWTPEEGASCCAQQMFMYIYHAQHITAFIVMYLFIVGFLGMAN